MKKSLSLLALLLVVLTAVAKNPEKKMGAYLFTFFSDPTHSLFMAISYDGYTFTAVNDGKPVIGGDSIAAQHGIRDPHIMRAPNISPSVSIPAGARNSITVMPMRSSPSWKPSPNCSLNIPTRRFRYWMPTSVLCPTGATS